MSESLFVRFCLEEPLRSEGFESLLWQCFEALACSRSPPGSDDTSQFRYLTASTDPDLVSGASVDEAIATCADSEWGALWFWYDDLPVGIHRNGSETDGDTPGIPFVSLSVDESHTKPWRNDQPLLVTEFVLALSDYLSPIYVYGDTYLDESSRSEAGIVTGELEDLFWVNGFGPEMAARLGRDRLREAPAWRIDECDDGTVFLWVSPLPLSESRGDRLADLRAYFDLE